MPKHPVLRLRPPNRDPKVEVDAAMVGLLRQCWRLGLETRHCCQGDGGEDTFPYQLAYIQFVAPISAMLFAAAAGPLAWDNRAHKRRAKERPDRVDRWTWDWRLDGVTVRFPTRDIQRAEAALRRHGSPLWARVGADTRPTDARPSAPSCPICRGPVIARRRDATYCSRRCQLAARDRGKSANRATRKAVPHG